MKKQRLSALLAGAMVLDFGLTAGMVAATQVLYCRYRLHSIELNAAFPPYAFGYMRHVLLPLLFWCWLASCLLAVIAAVLLAVYGVCRRRRAIGRNRLAAVLCACVFPLSLFLFPDLSLTAISLIA